MDKDHIAKLVSLGSTFAGVKAAQERAAQIMEQNGYGYTLTNACAATLSEFMNLAGINVPITLRVTNLARRVAARGWDIVAKGHQHPGDVAIAENDVHIFLVVKTIDQDEMIIADNQAPGPHKRRVRGDPSLHHSPVSYFLRAQGAATRNPGSVEIDKSIPDPAIFPDRDEDTNDLSEPFDDDGRVRK
jgi:hypothetical protein